MNINEKYVATFVKSDDLIGDWNISKGHPRCNHNKKRQNTKIISVNHYTTLNGIYFDHNQFWNSNFIPNIPLDLRISTNIVFFSFKNRETENRIFFNLIAEKIGGK